MEPATTSGRGPGATPEPTTGPVLGTTPLTVRRATRDGRVLVLVDQDGSEYHLEVDGPLREALHPPHEHPPASAPGQPARRTETTMETSAGGSALRPRDIQARIRAGATPEDVAAAAGTPLAKVMPFANPVLAERAHVAERAQRSSVRRRGGDPAAVRTLGDAAAARLREHGGHPDAVAWDAWRRDDGRWTLTAGYTSAARSGLATFAFDVPGNYVLAEDDDARWLVGEPLAEVPPAPTAPADDLEAARRRRQEPPATAPQAPQAPQALEEPPNDEFPLDQLPLDQLPLLDEPTLDLGETAAHVRAARVDPARREVPPAPAPEPQPAQEPAQEPEAAAPEPAPRKAGRKGRRASVPSWDEIMFGGGGTDASGGTGRAGED